MKNIILFAVLVSFHTKIVWAWGGRGHDSICETATFLVQEPGLAQFLKSKPHIMGHLCNVPDTQWRSLDKKAKSAGDPTHYVDPEILGFIPKTLPLDLKKLTTDFTGKTNQYDTEKKIFSVTREMGTSWWRVDQFMRLISGLKPIFEKAPAALAKSDEQNEQLPYNKAVYDFLVYSGVMGHFVGDTSMPYHNTTNYDGWKNGHGGIHGYYEDQVVSEISGDLHSKILKGAKKIKKADYLKSDLSTLEKMRIFSQISFDEIKKLEAWDPLIKKSEVKIENGMSLRTPAQRKLPAEALKKIEPLLISQMARSSVFLAHLWDEAYRSAGKPDLTKYKSYKYPTTVEFIFPDYE